MSTHMSRKTMRLMGEDSMLLAQLVETLGTVAVCAQEKSDHGAMVEQLLQFLEPLRAHTDVVVRRAVLHNIAWFVKHHKHQERCINWHVVMMA